VNPSSVCNCGRPTRDDAYVCEDCLSSLFAALGEIPALDDELETTITRQRALPTEGGAASAEAPMPWNQRASEARRHLRHTLVTWVRHCIEDDIRSSDPNTGWPADTIAAMSRWLMWRVDGLGLNDLGPDAVEEITNAVASCWRVVDRPAERTYHGPCTCGRDLYAKPRAATVTCPACETEHDIAALETRNRGLIETRLWTLDELMTALGRFGFRVPRKTVQKWIERHRLVDHGERGSQRVYALADALELAGQWEARHARSTRVVA
jgi:hypothetical protein